MVLIGLWHAADEWLELAPNILLPTCTEDLALAQSRLNCLLRGFPSPGSLQDVMTMESGPSATIVWLIQTDTPSCPVQAQHPHRLLTCPRLPAQMALALAQSCSNMTQLHHLEQLRRQLPRRSQWPGRQQALMGVPRLGILLSGQDMRLGLSPHLLLATDHPHPPPPPALHHTITIPPLCPALIPMHTLVLQAHSHHTPPFHNAHTALSHL